MARISELGLRWALAYLLLISGIDAIANQQLTGNIHQSFIPVSVGVFMALLMMIGSVLMIIGWQLQRVAYSLAAIVAISAMQYQSVLGLLLVGALIVLGMRASCLKSVSAKGHACPPQCC